MYPLKLLKVTLRARLLLLNLRAGRKYTKHIKLRYLYMNLMPLL